MFSASEAMVQQVKIMLKPWYESIQEPSAAQQKVLENLLKHYAKTGYGIEHSAGQISNIDEFRRAFPIATYKDYKPLIQKVMEGETSLLLSDEPIGWAITRGTTGDESKFIPMTPTDLKMRVSAGRAMMNYIGTSQQYDIFQGENLNLNFPSVVGKVKAGEKELEYGYSSGIYVKHVSNSTPIKSTPTQDDIDALGGGKTIKDWEARFELAYKKCLGHNVTQVGGVAPTAISFGRHLKRKHNVYPKNLWKVRIMTLGSLPGINTRYSSTLNALYGKAVIREIYGATEGMFGQQMDDKRAWVPNYDLFFFEVQTFSGVKMLHEMKPNETGSLIVSTPILPRYKIGDVILSLGSPYYRCIGRDYWWTPFYYAWGEISTFNFGRL
jgi:hypothetical protein